ncbi:MAG: hypothetical protein ACW976_05410, partial [Candidatus Ranarchaeia archaeon]
MDDTPFVERRKSPVFVLDSRRLLDGMFNSIISPEGLYVAVDLDQLVESEFEISVTPEIVQLLNKSFTRGTLPIETEVVTILGAGIIKDVTEPNPGKSSVVNILLPLFMNRVLRIKENFENFRRLHPENSSMKTGIGDFVNILEQHSFPINPIAPNYQKPPEEEANIYAKLPSARDIEGFDVFTYGGMNVPIKDIKNGYKYRGIITHPDPMIRTRFQIRHDKKTIVMTELFTTPQNVLKIEDNQIHDWSLSGYKGPKIVENFAIDMLLGD